MLIYGVYENLVCVCVCGCEGVCVCGCEGEHGRVCVGGLPLLAATLPRQATAWQRPSSRGGAWRASDEQGVYREIYARVFVALRERWRAAAAAA